MPRGYSGKSSKEDVDDAVLNSEYDEKFKKVKEKEKLGTMLKKVKDYILRIDPKLENYLDIFRGCHDLLKRIEV